MIIATSGHVDHGKTSLVRNITGVDTDRLQEEKTRGLTIDLGYAYTQRNDNQLGFIDVPGHIRFINNMVAGVGEIDFGLLVIAADDGPMPQTREHLAILNLLGVSHGAIALTKTDRVDANRIKQVHSEIEQLVSGTFLAGKDAPVFEVSNETKAGITALTDYLFEFSSRIKDKAAFGYFRLSIDRCFTVKGSGLVVTGSVLSGAASVGDQVVINPGKFGARIRGIHRQNQEANTGQAGDRCAINLSAQGLEKSDIHRGSHLTTNLTKIETNRCDILLTVLPDEEKPLKHWTSVHVHSAASHTTGRVATLESNFITQGTRGIAQMVLTESLCLCVGDRIILRDQAAERTLGGGIVLDPVSTGRGRAKPERVALLNELKAAYLGDKIDIAIYTAINAHPYGVARSAIEDSFNLKPDELNQYLQQLNDARRSGVTTPGQTSLTRDKQNTAEPVQVSEDDQLLSDINFALLTTTMSERLTTILATDKQKKGLTLNQISASVSSKLSAPVALLIAKKMVAGKRWVLSNGLYALIGHQVALSGAAATLWNKVEPILKADPIKPPVLHDLAKTLGLPPRALDKLLLEITKLGYLIKPVSNRYFLPEGMSQLEDFVYKTAALNEGGKFSVKEYRDVTGLGRNLCIEILEHFDIKRITQRIGDQRVVIAQRQ